MKTKKMLELEDSNGYRANFHVDDAALLGVWVTLDGVFNVHELKEIIEALEEATDAEA